MAIPSPSVPVARRAPLAATLLALMLVWSVSPLGWVLAALRAEERNDDSGLLAANLVTGAFVVAVPVAVLLLAKRTGRRLVTWAAIAVLAAGAVVWAGLALYDILIVD